MALESIFVGSADIRVQLPEDSKRFDATNAEFQTLARSAPDTVNVVEACNMEGRQESLDKMLEELELCEKALQDYLESKRIIFPRFYFVAPADLLEILSKGSNPQLIQKHIPKCFDAIKTLEYKTDDSGAFTKMALGMHSKEGEYVAFPQECDCSGAVEVWLNEVVGSMRGALAAEFRTAVASYDEQPRTKWFFNNSAQNTILTTRVAFTNEIDDAFDQLEDGNDVAIKDCYQKQLDQLAGLIELINGDMSKLDRKKIIQLCTLDVHARDVALRLIEERVESGTAFQWQSQLRYYQSEKTRDCEVKICDAEIAYQYEYVGVCGSLVITALGAIVGVLLKIDEIAVGRDTTFSEAYSLWAQALGVTDYYVVFAYFTCIFVTWTIVREFHLGAMVRKRKAGDSYLGSMTALTMKAPRRYGGYIVHLGIVFMFVAFTGKFFKTQEEKTVSPGEVVAAEDYRLTYATKKQFYDEDNGYAADRAIITVIGAQETVAEREVASLAGWLQEQNIGVFHIETKLGSPKITIRFEDEREQSRITDDIYLAMQFRDTFKLETENRQAKRLVYRIADEQLVSVVPMVAMNTIRVAKSAFQSSSSLGAGFVSSPGSPLITLSFQSEAEMDAFLKRVEEVSAPPHLLAANTNHDLEALQVIDERTGVQRTPEVRYYPKHTDSPTTEASITSSFKEDLYLAIQPSGGVMSAFANMDIKLLTVIFPFVNFLWTGGILIVFGIIVCMTPRWFARTLINVTRSRKPKPSPQPAAVGLIFFGLILGGTMLATAPAAQATQRLPTPAGFTPPKAAPLEDVLSLLQCVCGVGDDSVRMKETLADEPCKCPRADGERKQISALMSKYEAEDQASGRAKLEVLTELTSLDSEWLERLRYSREDYEFIMTSTKTTCEGERGLLLSQAKLGCSVRNRWVPRFKVMLASGMTPRTIFEFYVDENNVTMSPSRPWTYDDLYAAADKPMTWAVPLTLSITFIVGFVWFMLRRTRRLDSLRQEPGTHGTGESSETSPYENEQRLRLADEMDAYDI